MKTHNLAFIDLETTGLDVERHEIIEIGCIIARQIPNEEKGPDVEIIEEFEIKIKPERIEDADPKSLHMNGYNEKEWENAIPLTEALTIVAEKTKGASIVGQGVFFDWMFLEAGFKKTGIKNRMHFHKIDLISMAFTKLYNDPSVQKFSLGALAEHFGVENKKAHTALADIRATFEIYKKILDLK